MKRSRSNLSNKSESEFKRNKNRSDNQKQLDKVTDLLKRDANISKNDEDLKAYDLKKSNSTESHKEIFEDDEENEEEEDNSCILIESTSNESNEEDVEDDDDDNEEDDENEDEYDGSSSESIDIAHFKKPVIKKILQNITKTGNFAVYGEATELPSIPGLFINNFGTVSLPLTQLQAKELIKTFTQTTYGDEIVDKEVRDTYQIEASSIKLQNPEWELKLKLLVDRVVKDLGCLREVTHHLHKLLLYDKSDGHFKKHRNTEKEKGMFATLVIQLPSIYTGGEFRLKHNNVKIEFDFGEKSGRAQFMNHFTAHYADIEHEILPITSGYRLALVYSLCWKDDKRAKSYDERIKLTNSLVEALNNLHPDENKVFALYLDHYYTPAALMDKGVKAFKGADADRTNFIKNANSLLDEDKKLNFYIVHSNYLLTWTGISSDFDRYDYDCAPDEDNLNDTYDENDENPVYEINFGNDYELESIKETIQKWYTETGDEFLKNVLVPIDFISNTINPHADRIKPWLKRKRVNVKGYAGKTALHYKYYLVFWPKSIEYELLLKVNYKTAIDTMYAEAKNINTDASLLETFKTLLNTIKNDDNHRIDMEHMNKILKTVIETKNLELVLLFFNHIFSRLKSKLNQQSYDLLVCAIHVFSWDELKSAVEKHFLPLHKKLQKSCEFIEYLLNKNLIDLANKIAASLIIPLLSNQKEFAKIYHHKQDKSSQSYSTVAYCNLASLIVQLKRDDLLKLFKEYIIGTLSDESLKSLLDRIISDNFLTVLESSLPIYQLFQHRINHLTQILIKVPAFSWSMPNAKLERHPTVEEFLKSTRTEMIYCGFSGIQQARQFVTTYAGCKDGYSFRAEESVSDGKNVQVTIKKTKKLYESNAAIVKCYRLELAKLQFKLDSFKCTKSLIS